ncbi:hypothetical protein TNCV_3930631 [Trichonephila clavipes]|nr:hypothetical protein TNCV_3930631 [Trichonephila clavipes]
MCGLLFRNIAIHIGRLSCEYGTDGFRKVILKAMKDLNGLPTLMPKRADKLSGQSCSTSWNKSRSGIVNTSHVIARTVRRRPSREAKRQWCARSRN